MDKINEIEIWGGIECTINRVGNQYIDQLEYSGYYERGTSDIDLVADLGMKCCATLFYGNATRLIKIKR